MTCVTEVGDAHHMSPETNSTVRTATEMREVLLREYSHLFFSNVHGPSLLVFTIGKWLLIVGGRQHDLAHTLHFSSVNFAAASPPGTLISQAECLSADQAIRHIGTTGCVSATIVGIDHDREGSTYLRLGICENGPRCGVTAVVASDNLSRFKNLEHLIGSCVELRGKLEDIDGHVAIMLREPRQLRPALAPEDRPLVLPMEYEADHKGSYSAGKFSHGKSAPKTVKKKSPATFPIDVPEDSESD